MLCSFTTRFCSLMLIPCSIIILSGKDSINSESRLEKMKPPRGDCLREQSTDTCLIKGTGQPCGHK